MGKFEAFTGDQAFAEAMRQINPDVVAAYPIAPQTETVEVFADFVADDLVDTEFVTVESEHSAMSACVGASAAGARVMTATSANGLALLWEVLYIAASNRCPIVMSLVNRALFDTDFSCNRNEFSMTYAVERGALRVVGDVHRAAVGAPGLLDDDAGARGEHLAHLPLPLRRQEVLPGDALDVEAVLVLSLIHISEPTRPY